jgi:hypothetical protein
LPAPVSFRKKSREAVRPAFHSFRAIPTQDSAPDPAGTSRPGWDGGPGRRLRRWLVSPLRAAARWPWQVPLIALSIFLLSRPYQGIIQDGYIYMGRALADLDPNGVGRDLMFVHDGQFGFSLFRFAATGMTALSGLSAGAKSLAILAALAWFFAAAALARQFASGGAVWAVVIFAALLPNAYGAPSPFGFAELIAIPRPFAEALVLAGLAALAARRDAVSLGCFVAAALLHPIMALAGFGVFFVVLGLEDKRWLLFCVLIGAVSILAAAAGAPVLGRLFVSVDSAFRGSYDLRKPALFPSLWPVESFPPLIVQAVTIAIAAHLQQGRRRRILGAIIFVGLGGIAAAAIFGDWLSSLLAVQAQPWRAVWLMAVAGATALGICAVDLWRRDLIGRMVLALLVLSWSFEMPLLAAGPAAMLVFFPHFGLQFVVASTAAILALCLHFGAKRFQPLLKSQYVLGTWVFTVVVATIWTLRIFAAPWNFAFAAPGGYDNLELVVVRDLLALPLCALAAYFAIVKPRIGSLLSGGCAVLLFSTVVWFWDHRPPAQRTMEENQPWPELTRLIGQRQGEVLWIDGLAEAWFILGRPQCASPLQRAPTVFSPALAAEWRRRMQVLMTFKLADRMGIAPWKPPESADRSRVSNEGVRQLCARNDAPAWIIAPLEHGSEPPAGIEMKLWQLPHPQFRLTEGDGDYVWQRIDTLGVIPCRGAS